MREATGHWIPAAIECAHRIAAFAPGRRAAALQHEASLQGIKPSTLRRVLSAARYVEHHANEGVECRASVMAVEALVLLEKRAPARAAELRSQVFSGEITSRELAKVAKQEQPRQSLREFEEGWHSLALSACESCFDDFKSFTSKQSFDTEKRGFFLVDVEVELPGPAQAAIFFSPEILFSSMRSQPFSRQLTMALAALASYEQVVMLLTTKAEEQTFLYAAGLLRSSTRERLKACDYTTGTRTLQGDL